LHPHLSKNHQLSNRQYLLNNPLYRELRQCWANLLFKKPQNKLLTKKVKYSLHSPFRLNPKNPISMMMPISMTMLPKSQRILRKLKKVKSNHQLLQPSMMKSTQEVALKIR